MTNKMNPTKNGFAKTEDSKTTPTESQRQEHQQRQDGQESSLPPITARGAVQDQIAAINDHIELLGSDVVQAAVEQAHRIAQVTIAYPALVAQLVDQNLRYAKEEGLLGKPSVSSKFNTSLNTSALLQSRLEAHKPSGLMGGREFLALPASSQSEACSDSPEGQDCQTTKK